MFNPVRFTGLLLAGSAQGTHIADYMDDLASVGGRVQLIERPVEPEEVGGSINDLPGGGKGLRVYRGDAAYGYWECGPLEEGDVLVEIRPTNNGS